MKAAKNRTDTVGGGNTNMSHNLETLRCRREKINRNKIVREDGRYGR